MLNEIFKDFSQRLSSENNLSDFTWSLLKNSHPIMKTFMDLFNFPFNIDFAYTIDREYTLDNNAGRIDFIVNQDQNIYLIENKKNDTNYHFTEYSGAFNEEGKKIHYGLISNHKLSDASIKEGKFNNFCIAYWWDFVKNLKELSLDEEQDEVRTLYTTYLKGVLNMIEIKEIRLNNLSSIYHFANMAKNVIDSYENSDLEFLPSNSFRKDRYDRVDRYISIGEEGNKHYPCLAFYFDENPFIAVSFESNWGKNIYKKHYKTPNVKHNMFEKVYDKDKWEVQFRLNDAQFSIFLDSNKDKQIELLTQFMSEVLDYIKDDL